MAFKLDANVSVQRDRQGRVRLLNHVQAPFVASAGDTAESLAAAYVRDVASVYNLPAEWLSHLEARAPEEADRSSLVPPAGASDELRLAHVKSTMDTTVVGFQQLRYGLPVWEAGLSVVVLDKPRRVTSSQSSAREDVDAPPPDAEAPFAPVKVTQPALAARLKLKKDADLRINRRRSLVYRYDSEQRLDPETARANEDSDALCAPPPTLPVPEPPAEIATGKHYVVTEALFTLPVEGMGDVHWRAFLEQRTGAVLYLRAFVAHVTGSVFATDPLTASGGTTPASPLALLNPLRTNVIVSGLAPAMPQALSGEFVQLAEMGAPPILPPTEMDGTFVYDATTDDFSAINAYHHCDGFFRMMAGMGFDVFAFFDGTVANPGFPVPVDHRALGNVVNAQGPGNMFGDGSGGFRFALAQTGTNVGIANDHRVVAHEFCHALLWDSVHSPNFGFAHSAGDALGAILNDPGSLAPDRGQTFPWIAAGTPGLARRHDRPVGAGWAWGGVFDFGSYSSEQILATTLFRLYLAAGGDNHSPTQRRQVQEMASRWIAYLIIRAIGSLATSPITPTPNPDVFATALMNADAGTGLFDGKPGGLVHKVVRWAFEKQGLYQAPGAPSPVTTPGAPPDVDVYIDDGRGGEYLPYLDDVRSTTEIWNRRTNAPSSSPLEHEVPVTDAPNYAWVRVKNRGALGASDVVVRAYRARPGTARLWPADWEPLTTASLPVPAGIAVGGSVIVGPFQWTPRNIGDELLLMTVSATGDLSNVDAASMLSSAVGPTPDELLVRLDNNTAERQLAPVPHPDPCHVPLPEIDPCCQSPCPPPWRPFDQCLSWYDYRLFPWQGGIEEHRRLQLVFRVLYHHCLRLRGRQQGPLLFTTTLLPGETLKLYHHERYRRTRATTDVFSVHASFRQSVSALHETRRRDASHDFQKILASIRADGDTNVTVGGMLFPVTWDAEGHDTTAAFERAASVEHVSEDFNRTLTASSQQIDVERSIVVSTFEDRETQDITSRTITNENECYAVTYFVRRVMEVYTLLTTVAAVEWQLVVPGAPPQPWRSIDDTQGVPGSIRGAIDTVRPYLPKVGAVIEPEHAISLPTDGTLYEADLAHCSSCEPERQAAQVLALEKQKAEVHRACLESQLLALELERRRQLLAAGQLGPFQPTLPAQESG